MSHLESFQTLFQNDFVAKTATWTNESGVGKKNGPLPETGVGASFGGGKTQCHRIVEQAQPIVSRRRVGASRSPSGEVCSPRRSVTCQFSAAGLAGDTNEHYKVLLDDEEATLLITEAAEHLSKADFPSEIADALAMEAMTALMKDNGRIRGIVTGDFPSGGGAHHGTTVKFECACMPFQYALSTRAGTDCVALVTRSLIELDPRKTLLSIDGIVAFDLFKRKAMMEALHTNPELASLLPFVRLFHGKDSKCVWYDDDGLSHEICQGEGGEQGDPLMPALYALGQHAALAQVNATLREGELLFAYIDDIYVLCDPDRVAEMFVQVRHALFQQAGVQVNLGKTKVWNGAIVKPTNMHVIGGDAWKGEGLEEERGLLVLGVPVGHHAFVQKWLADKEGTHLQLFSRIPAVQDAQSAWLLLLMCAGPRANHLLRNLPPFRGVQFQPKP